MKSIFILPSTILLAATTVAADSKSTTFPGRCTTTADCSTYGANYACVSVDTSVAGLEHLSICIPGAQVCSGRIAGLCPTFASWPAKYRAIQPICAFVAVNNCDEQYNVTVNGTSGSLDASDVTVGSAIGNGTVQCYQRNFTANNESVVVTGIYQCIDKAKYVANNGGFITNITDTVVESCGWNTSTQTLCSGQGTCSPLIDFAQNYTCKCNAGYNSSDFCLAVQSNECSSVSQCGTKGTCAFEKDTTRGDCSCAAGAKGNQCLLCDASASADVVCSGHGTCGTDGVCTCSANYNGTFCGEATGHKNSTTPSAATSLTMPISLLASALLLTFFA